MAFSFYNSMETIQNSKFYYLKDTKFEDSDLEKIITNTNKDEDYDSRLNRDFMHRMCFVLAQNLFKDESFMEKPENGEELPHSTEDSPRKTLQHFLKFIRKKHRAIQKVEKDCHQFLSNLYDYPKNFFGNWSMGDIKEKNDWDQAKPSLVRFSPIILERKARVFKTTGRYVYKGGKSLNVNVSTSFNIKSSKSFSTSTRMAYKPYAWFKNIVIWTAGGAAIGSLGGVTVVPGAVLGALGGIVSTLLDGFDVSRANTSDERQSRNSTTTVSSGTFLVTQQASLDIELGEYERCLVARFHPSFLRLIWKEYLLKEELNLHGENITVKKEEDDFDSLGIMICTGKRENKCLPVKEKYFYFTQHFTDGDMLDVGDLHNHPWMLQLRGLRDYMAFISLIGAREVSVDQNDWFDVVLRETYKDALAFKHSGSETENSASTFNLVEKDSDINWTLNELSHVYFNILPTFPGFYTFFEEDQNKKQETEWPWRNPDPNYLLNMTNPGANHIQSKINCEY